MTFVIFTAFRCGGDIFVLQSYKFPSLETIMGGFRCSAMDQHENKSAQAQRRQHFGDPAADVLDAAPVIFWVTDVAGSCKYLNREYYEYTGKSDVNGDGWRSVIHPDDKQRTERLFFESHAKQLRFCAEYRIRRHDGVYRLIRDVAAPRYDSQGVFIGFVGSIFEINEANEPQAQLRTDESLFRQFNEHSSNVIWIRDANTMQFEYISPAVESVYGVAPSELKARPDHLEAWLDLLHPDDRGNALEALRQVQSGCRVIHEFRVVRPDGKLRWIRDTDFPLTDEQGQVQRVAGIGQDFTEEKQNEWSLREREERLSIIVKNARDYAIFTTDENGFITDWREGAEAIFGWSHDEAIGMDSRLIYTTEDRLEGTADNEMQRARAYGKALDLRWHLRKDGSKVYIDGSMFRIGEGKTAGFLKIGQDITSRHNAANALRASEGRLHIVVAELQHRTRNLLGVVNATMSSTIKESENLAEFEIAFTRRLRALGRVNSLLSSQAEGQRISFDELIKMELEGVGAYDPDADNPALQLVGPAGVELRSRSIQIFALAIHELATNAIKHGALSQPTGRLSITWRVEPFEDGSRLWVSWEETGVAMPDQELTQPGVGYGRELIEQALPYQLEADTQYSVLPDGIRCVISLPIEPRESPENVPR